MLIISIKYGMYLVFVNRLTAALAQVCALVAQQA